MCGQTTDLEYNHETLNIFVSSIILTTTCEAIAFKLVTILAVAVVCSMCVVAHLFTAVGTIAALVDVLENNAKIHKI